MTTDKTPTEALAQLRHLYAQLKSQDGMSRTDRAHIADGILSPAIAALEKWGQPAQAAEPVAWLDPWTGTKVTTDYDAYGKHGIPLYTAPQPVARERLTPERVKEIVRGAGYDQCGIPDTERAAFINGLRHGEREHGIRGDQHVS